MVIANIINNSFKEGKFPDALKFAKVVPIYKDGTKTEVENYRPISLLTLFSKIYEKLMHKRLVEFLEQNSTLYENQYGFRSGRSCEHALLNAQNILNNSLNNNQISLLLLIDFSKAFDMVDHKILLHKLHRYGIRGNALEWLTSYLSQREQYVSINSKDSTRAVVKYGIPQYTLL